MKIHSKYVSSSRLNLAAARVWPGFLVMAVTACLRFGGAAEAQATRVVTDHSSYYPREAISVTFERGPGNPRDWVGVYPDGIVPGSVPSTIWLYVNGTQGATVGRSEGVLVFPNGLATVGDWNAFFLLNGGYTTAAQTAFKVIDEGLPLVRSAKRQYTTGGAISITFTNGPGNATDKIAVHPKGAVPGGPVPTLWAYVNGTQTSTTGSPDGTVNFASGLTAPGDYDVHLLLNDGDEIAASEVITVVQVAGTKPRLISVQPANESTNIPPVLEFSASITNGASKVVAGSVALRIDGTGVTPIFGVQNDLVTIGYTNETLLPPLTQHTYVLTFSDNATPANLFTNQGVFTVGPYRNIVLPAPLYFEDFDNTAEGTLPTGWMGVNFTEIQNPEFDLGNLDSASYATWTVVNVDRFTGSFVTYSNPDNQQSWEDDYHRVLALNPFHVVSGKQVKEPLAKGRFLFGNSGYRNGRSQVLYAFTPDYNLAGKTDVHLAFYSLWEQNQDSVGAVEYSVDGGQNWLPIVYLVEAADIVRDGAGNINAVATFSADHGDAARYTDPVTGEEKGGTYGTFIGAPVSEELASFISVCRDDNISESKRVELFRLPKADNQAKVRFRFAHAGTDSWYFGIDNFGLYSIPAAAPVLSVSAAGSTVTISWPGSVAGFVLESSEAVVGAAWAAVSGVANNSVTQNTNVGARFYRLRKP